ncbi:MAG: hypothetical protein M1831_000829 [Alyxoria varia]|nr:MAG: hypothetical protein M1831_000829 [Alyxoria varia]
MAQKTCDNLSATFGRPITGVHNRTYGVIGDLFECLLQRSLRFYTQDTRIAQASLREDLENESIKKIVVIAHSQGGILVSLILERLYTMLPAHLFGKLEIYTFGSAASHFHNPLISQTKSKSEPATPGGSGILMPLKTTKSAPPLLQSPPPMADRLIGTIEHYVNSRDLVPRWGVLYHVLMEDSGTTYSGRVFVHENATGHLFDQHYLEPMFPILEKASIEQGEPKLFLNHKVNIGSTGLFRASTLGDMADKYQNRLEQVHESNLGESKAREDDESLEMVKVKHLSRLWGYMGGRSPQD